MNEAPNKPENENLSFDLESIVESIEDEKCVLFIGPQIYLDNEGKVLEDEMLKTFQTDGTMEKFVLSRYEDGFYHFNRKASQRKFIKRMKDFHQSGESQFSDLLHKIVRLPFHLIINFTVDDLLVKTYDAYRFPCNHHFFDKDRPPIQIPEPRIDRPLIYNILGSFTKDNSLILTHNDLFDYLVSILKEENKTQTIKEYIMEAEQFIFIGLPFEKWYMQLLLRILKINQSQLGDMEKYATMPIAHFVKKRYQEQFKINFIANDNRSFVDILFNRFEKEKKLKPLKKELVKDLDFSRKDLKNWIAQGKEKKAFDLLDLFFEVNPRIHKDLENEYIVLRNQHAKLKYEERLGMKSINHQNDLTRVINSLIQLIDRIDLD